jgi:serine/threonine-protein kinase
VLYWLAVKTCVACSINYPDAVEFCPRDGQKLPGAPVRNSVDSLVGQTIDGRYVVESLLGEGGMGHVYAARHAIIDKRVAIKVLRKEQAQDEAAAQRFIVEAKAASKIGHQNIVDITDFGVLPEGNAYFVMEYLHGPTLGKLIHELRQMPFLRIIAITTQAARGLMAAHAKSIIHRDLKPENIFAIEKDGHADFVKIVDFGIAKDIKAGKRLTAVGMVLGTPEYMSPEQATGQETDHRVDQYALGCIVYEMLTGDVPFKGENAPKTLTKHVFEPVVAPSKLRPDIPPVLERIVLRMLHKKPAERFADMRELIDALEVADRELRAGGTAVVPRLRKPAAPTDVIDRLPRSRAPLFALAGLAALVLGGAAVTAVVTRHPPAAAPSAAAPSAAPAVGSVAPAPAAAPGVVPAPTSADVELQLTTVPAGAEVLLDREQVGTSPVTVRRPRSESATVTVRRTGYRDVTRTLMLDRDQSVEIVLQPKQAKVATRANPGFGTPAASQKPAPPARGHHVSDLRNPFE